MEEKLRVGTSTAQDEGRAGELPGSISLSVNDPWFLSLYGWFPPDEICLRCSP